jgi:hypothetical protein
MAIKESAELRDRVIANGTRVGRVVASSTGPMGQAAAKFHQHHSYAEVWEDGPRLRELKARQAGILARREELEKRKRQVAKDIRKADKELQQRTISSSSSATVEADSCGSSSGAAAAAAAATAAGAAAAAGTTADETGSATTGSAASSNATADAAATASTAAGVNSDVFSSAAGSSGTAAAHSTAIAAAGTASTAAAAAAAAMSCPSSTSNTLQQQQLQLQLHDDDFELLNADETVKLHMAHLKREEALLAEERKRLEAEKAEQIRIWRRVTLEDRSRFCRQPLLGQRYLITTLLGKGGFSEVWRAFDLAEVREVAIKVSCCCSTMLCA